MGARPQPSAGTNPAPPADKGGQSPAGSQLTGNWQAVSLVENGQKLPEADVKPGRLTFEGNRFTLEFVSRHEKPQRLEGTYKLDPGKTPRHLDWTVTSGPAPLQGVLKGIYELKDDTLKICHALPAQGRPAEFASGSGSTHRLLVFRRARK